MKKKVIIPQIKAAAPQKRNIKFYVINIVHTIIFCICALVIGIITGAFDAAFMKVLAFAEDIRGRYPFYCIPFLCLSGLLIYFLFERFCKEQSGTMSLYFPGEQDKRAKTKLRLIPIVIFGTWITHLFGGSAGTENAAIQTGGTLGSLISHRLSLKNKDSEKILTVTGMAAAFGGLFGTPAAAVFFAVEVLSPGYIEVPALLPALGGAYSSDFISQPAGKEKFTYIPDLSPEISVYFVAVLCISAILFGMIGGLFAYLFKKIKKVLTVLIPNPYIKIAAAGAAISIFSLFLYSGRYSGTGMNIITDTLGGSDIYYWDFILKFLLTVLTLSAGYQGGAVIPLFSIGTALGAVTAMIFNMPVVLFAVLGCAAVFGAATNTLLAPIFLGAEIFGYQYLPFFFAVCIIAYIFNGNNSIYSKYKSPASELLMIKK